MKRSPALACSEAITHYLKEDWGMVSAERLAEDISLKSGRNVSINDAIDLSLEHRKVKLVAILPSVVEFGCRVPHVVLDIQAMNAALEHIYRMKDRT